MLNATNIPPATGQPAQPTNKFSTQRLKAMFLIAKNKLNADPKMKRILVVAGVSFAAIVLLLFGAGVVKTLMQRRPAKVQATPTPQATVTPPAEISNPSRYATDSGVLALEERIRLINQDAGTLDVREYSLRPPTLDFDINF